MLSCAERCCIGRLDHRIVHAHGADGNAVSCAHRIISGLSRAVVVIEAAERSGRADHGKVIAEQREVFAAPGPAIRRRPQARCNFAQRDSCGMPRMFSDLKELPVSRPVHGHSTKRRCPRGLTRRSKKSGPLAGARVVEFDGRTGCRSRTWRGNDDARTQEDQRRCRATGMNATELVAFAFAAVSRAYAQNRVIAAAKLWT